MKTFWSQGKAPMSCDAENGCWCVDHPNILPVPDRKAEGCLCRTCLSKRPALRVVSPGASRLERYFPVKRDAPALVILLNPAQDSTVPALDLLKLSTFLRKRGYAPYLQKGSLDTTSPEPHAVVL